MADRNHTPEPTHRDLCSEVRELRADLRGHKELMDERNRRYEQSFRESKEAVSAALQAAKEQTQAAFLASEKAIVKAEAAQNAYNTSHNDLLRKQELLVPRIEMDSRFKSMDEKLLDSRKVDDAQIKSIDEKIGEIRKSRDVGEGRSGGIGAFGVVLLGVGTFILGLGALILTAVRHL